MCSSCRGRLLHRLLEHIIIGSYSAIGADESRIIEFFFAIITKYNKTSSLLPFSQ